jgi:hypothetical protein
MKGKCMQCGGAKKMKAGGSSSNLGKKSKEANYDNNPAITKADIIIAAKQKAGTAKMGGSYKKGGTVKKKK